MTRASATRNREGTASRNASQFKIALKSQIDLLTQQLTRKQTMKALLIAISTSILILSSPVTLADDTQRANTNSQKRAALLAQQKQRAARLQRQKTRSTRDARIAAPKNSAPSASGARTKLKRHSLL